MKKLFSFIIIVCMLLPLAGCANNDLFTKASGSYASTPFYNSVRIYCGNENEISKGHNENYLKEESGTMVSQESGGRSRTFRCIIEEGGYVIYKIPADKKASKMFVSLTVQNEFTLYADNKEIYTSPALPSGYGSVDIPYEFEIKDKSIWRDGYIEIKIVKNSPSIYATTIFSIELGEGGMFQNRLRRIIYDVSDVEFMLGCYDGYSHEFRGADTEITVGEDISNLNPKAKLKVNFNIEKEENVKYILLTGMLNDVGTNYVDVLSDGVYEYDSPINTGHLKAPLERIVDIDVTDLISTGENSVTVYANGNNGFIDFVALVKVKEGITDPNTLRVEFSGSEMAENWTKLVNTSLYFTNELFIEQSSGWVGCSPPNGIYTWLYWTPDAFSIINELAAWGYHDVSELGFMYSALSGNHYNNDNGTAISSTITLGYLMDITESKTFYNLGYYQMTETLNRACNDIDASPIGLLKGSNFEMAFGTYDIGTNVNAGLALINGSKYARANGDIELSEKYLNYGELLLENVKNRYIAKNDQYTRKGTLYSGVSASGIPVRDNNGYLSTDSYLWANKELYGDLIEASALTMDYIETGWDNWLLYGNNRGYTTSYGCMAARGGVVPLAHLALDEMNLVKKTMEHVIFNSSDYNFEHGNEGIQELSPWAIIRETHPHDLGVAPNSYQYIGNTPFNEDMNAIEFAVPLTTARTMAGVDDNIGLRIIPKLCENWNGVKVNSWPVRYYDGSKAKETLVTYDYSINATSATMDLYTKNKVKDVYVRVGPFDLDAEISKVTINGSKTKKYETIESGGYKWVAVNVNTSKSKTQIKVDINNANYTLFESLTLDKFTDSVSSLNTYLFEKSAQSGYVTSDIKLEQSGIGGVCVKSGNDEYVFAINTKDQKIYLSKNNTEVKSFKMNLYNNRTYTLKIRVTGGKLYCNLNGTDIIETDFTSDSFTYGLCTNTKAQFKTITMRTE